MIPLPRHPFLKVECFQNTQFSCLGVYLKASLYIYGSAWAHSSRHSAWIKLCSQGVFEQDTLSSLCLHWKLSRFPCASKISCFRNHQRGSPIGYILMCWLVGYLFLSAKYGLEFIGCKRYYIAECKICLKSPHIWQWISLSLL